MEMVAQWHPVGVKMGMQWFMSLATGDEGLTIGPGTSMTRYDAGAMTPIIWYVVWLSRPWHRLMLANSDGLAV